MGQSGSGLAQDIARSLVDVLVAYEGELQLLEREVPAVAPLRRAVGQAITDARHVVAEEPPCADLTLRTH